MNAMARPSTDPEASSPDSPVLPTLIGPVAVTVPLPDGTVVEVQPGEQWPAEADPSQFILPSEIWS